MNIAVIFAGGTGQRMNTKSKPKQFLEMHGKPILIHTLEIFEGCSDIDAIVVSCLASWISYATKLIKKYNLDKVKEIVPGGNTGQLSIYNGLCAAERITKDPAHTVVLIHDGVRPLINNKVIIDNIESVNKFGSAITCVSMKETVLLVDKYNKIENVPERNSCRLARAPQSFYLKDILRSQRKAINEGKTNFIDSCSLMSYYNDVSLHLVEGPWENIKITTPEDFYILRAILDAKEDAQIYGYGEENENQK